MNNNNNNLARLAIIAIVIIATIAIGALSVNAQAHLVRTTQSRMLPVKVSDDVASNYALRTMARQSKVVKPDNLLTRLKRRDNANIEY